MLIITAFCLAHSLIPAQDDIPQKPDPRVYFGIRVTDRETGRGIPLVRITTITNIEYFTDSAGWAAIFEPALMGREVYFCFESHGYRIEKDPLGGYGMTLKAVPGERANVTMKRDNIARRLYRITGSGIYQDSVLLGEPVPIAQPLMNAGVTGQDSTLAVIYKGNIFWAWGDTGHTRHPLAGNFKTTCGLSPLPGRGGLDPSVGVNIEYFTDGDYVRKMVPLPGANPYWIGCLVNVPDRKGRERLLTHYSKITPPMERSGRGLLEFDDDQDVFREIRTYVMDDVIDPDGHTFRVMEDGTEYVYYFGSGVYRTPANYEAATDHARYESFTCLKQGKTDAETADDIERDAEGRIVYSWKTITHTGGPNELRKWNKAGRMKDNENWFHPRDAVSGKPIQYHAGTVAWNPMRRRWVLVFNEIFGTSLLGEVWFAEGDTPLGPWVYAVKVVTHNKYSFYNSVQHSHLMQDSGKILYFEGTYTTLFSGNEHPTPRYDYNQIMYQLDMDDIRLFLPVPVYRLDHDDPPYYVSGSVPPKDRKAGIAFMAPDRPAENTTPVYQLPEKATGKWILTTSPSEMSSTTRPIFHVLNTDVQTTATRPLIEYVHEQTGARCYLPEGEDAGGGFIPQPGSLGRVWPYPGRGTGVERWYLECGASAPQVP